MCNGAWAGSMTVSIFPSADLRQHVIDATGLLMLEWSSHAWQRIRSMSAQILDEDASAAGIILTHAQLEAEIDRVDRDICELLKRRGFVAPYASRHDPDQPGAA